MRSHKCAIAKRTCLPLLKPLSSLAAGFHSSIPLYAGLPHPVFFADEGEGPYSLRPTKELPGYARAIGRFATEGRGR